MFGYINIGNGHIIYDPIGEEEEIILIKVSEITNIIITGKNIYIKLNDREYGKCFNNEEERNKFVEKLFIDIALENGFKCDDIIENECADTNIEELNFSSRTYNSLIRAGIKTIGDLSQMPNEVLKNTRNLGMKSYEEILQKKKELNLNCVIKRKDKIKVQEFIFKKEKKYE